MVLCLGVVVIVGLLGVILIAFSILNYFVKKSELERSVGIKLTVSLEVIGGFFNLIIGIAVLGVVMMLTRFSGSNIVFGMPLNLLIALFETLWLTLFVLSFLGFDLAFRFWGGRDSAWTRGLIHACVCFAVSVFLLRIRGILSILIYFSILI